MSTSKELVSVGERQVKLSNLEKELYLGDQVSKAEIIKYYLHVAPVMLHHIKGRPLSLIRYPDGIIEEHFFQKQLPDWTPQWVLPLKPKANMDTVFEASKELAREFVEQHPDETTLRIKKKARKGHMLIDIYRNRSHQTMISPYSLRAVAGASVSMPVSWEALPDIDDAGAYHINNAPVKIDADGYA